MVLADDSGLEIDYLNGAPGVYNVVLVGIICQTENNKIIELYGATKIEQPVCLFNSFVSEIVSFIVVMVQLMGLY